MGCGCSGPGLRLPRVEARGPRFLRVGASAGAIGGGSTHAHGACCDACAIGAPCGSDVSRYRDAGDADPFAPCKRRGESQSEYIRRTGTNAREFELASYCDARDEGEERDRAEEELEARGGVDAETWASWGPERRRSWLETVAREARLDREQTQRFVAGLVNSSFEALRNGLRTHRDIRIEEIRSGERVEIARIRYAAQGERAFLDDSRDTSRDTRNRTTSSSGEGTTAIVGLALLGRVLGWF